MPVRFSTLVAPALALLLAGGLFAQIRAYAEVDDTSAFHAQVRSAMEGMPYRQGVWEGVDISLPAAAGALLRPNVLFARRYTDGRTGVRANLLVIHCKDARDMSGHYPPNCYPGTGWLMRGQPRMHAMELFGRRVPVAEYAFTRRELRGEVSASIYNFFILPTGATATDMDSVRRASGDYRVRPYGAAQFQVVFDGSTPEEERLRVVHELLSMEALVSAARTLLRDGGGR